MSTPLIKTPAVVAAIIGAIVAFSIYFLDVIPAFTNRMSDPIDMPDEIKEVMAYDLVKSMKHASLIVNKNAEILIANSAAKRAFNLQTERILKRPKLREVITSNSSRLRFSDSDAKNIVESITSGHLNNSHIIVINGSYWHWSMSAIESTNLTKGYLLVGSQIEELTRCEDARK